MNKKVFVLGLDGGTWGVFRPLIEKGRMPNLARLVEDGVSGNLISTIPPITAPAWTTFQTGVNPGKHGVYDYLDYSLDRYKPPIVSSRSIKAKTVWEYINDAGKRLIAVGVPLTYPPKKVNGAMIGGLMTPSTSSPFMYPEDLYDEIIRAVGDYQIIMSDWHLSSLELESLIKRAIYIEGKRLEATFYLMDKYDWDFTMVQNQTLDGLQHFLWKYISGKEAHRYHRERTIVERFYEDIDNNLGAILEKLDNNCEIIVISDHGFGDVEKQINLYAWLLQEGLLSLSFSALTKIMKFVKGLDIFKLRRLLHSQKSQFRAKLGTLGIDWLSTEAFTYGRLYSHIFINCKEEQKANSAVRPDGEYENLRDDIKGKLLSLEDPETKKKVVSEVFKREEIYYGPMVKYAPDLIAVPSSGYSFTKRRDVSEVFLNCSINSDFSGNHVREGIYVFYGGAAKKCGTTLGDINMADMAPTILGLLDIEAPGYMDGKSLL